jgi:hypothetical protein
MYISNLVSVQNLVPGKKYFIDIEWNIMTDLRTNAGFSTIGIFVNSAFVKGRTYSFDTGLQVLLSRSRYEATFNINGTMHTVSAANHFYERISPSAYDIASVYSIYTLPTKMPIELKKYICDFSVNKRKNYYRKRPKPLGNLPA